MFQGEEEEQGCVQPCHQTGHTAEDLPVRSVPHFFSIHTPGTVTFEITDDTGHTIILR